MPACENCHVVLHAICHFCGKENVKEQRGISRGGQYTPAVSRFEAGRKAPPGDAAFGAGDRPAEFCASPHRSAWTSVPGPLLLSRSSAASKRGSRDKCNVCLGVPVNGESKSARPNFLEATACPNSAIQYWRCAHAMSTCATFEGIIAPPGKGPLSELRR